MVIRFIVKTVAFFALPVFLFSGWAVFIIFLDYTSYVESLKVPAEKDIVVCCDSQTKDSLDPSLFPRLFNFSTAASTPDQNLLRLRDLMKTNQGKLKYALVDVTPLHTGYDERIEPLADMDSPRVHALLHFYHYRETTRPFGSLTKLFRDVILVRKFHEFRKAIKKGRSFRSSLSGGFDPVKTKGFLDYPEKARKYLLYRAKKCNANPHYSGTSRLAELLRKQAEEIKKAGMRPLFMTTPVSPMMRKKLDAGALAALTNGVTELAEECGAPYFNYIMCDFPVECWRDANHMNISGASALTKMFRSDFEKYETSWTTR